MRLGRGLPPVVFHHPIYDLHQMLAYLPHPDTRTARMGAFEHHSEEVRRKRGIRESSRFAKADHALVRSKLVLLHDAPGGMVWIGQLGEGVAKGRAAFFHLTKLRGGATAPVPELAFRISAVLRVEILPLLLFVGDDPAHPFGNQLILRLEVAVQRHFVRLGRLGDRFDPHAADPLFMKQVSSRHQNPRAQRYGGPATFSRFQPVVGNICFHEMLYPSLTKMLPTGNIGVLVECYRSVTYYISTRSATMACGNLPLRSCAT